jgi:hypothetical protein
MKQKQLLPHTAKLADIHRLSAAVLKILKTSESGSSLASSDELNPFARALGRLSAFKEKLEAEDPDTKLIIELEDGEYRSCSLIFGPVIRLSRTFSTFQLDTDGTHFRQTSKVSGSIPGFLTGVIYSDANNARHALILQHSIREESHAVYSQLFRTLWEHAPHTNGPHVAVSSDRDTGLLALFNSLPNSGPSFFRCWPHVRRNISNHLSKLGRSKSSRLESTNRIASIVYSRTVLEFEKGCDELQQDDPALYEYFMTCEPVTFCYSIMGAARHEKMTTNSIESYWASILPARILPTLPQFFLWVYSHEIQKLRREEHESRLIRSPLTPYATSQCLDRANWARQRGYRVLEDPGGEALTHATVQVGQMTFTVEAKDHICNCQTRQFLTFPCSCMLTVLQSARISDVSPFIAHCYHTINWQAALRSSLPIHDPSIDLAALPFENSFCYPAEVAQGKGRPADPHKPRTYRIRKDRRVEEQAKLLQDFLHSNLVSQQSVETSEIPDASLHIEDAAPDVPLSQQLSAPIEGACTRCGNLTSNLHGCIQCEKPTHVFCGTLVGSEEDGFEAKVNCDECTNAAARIRRRGRPQIHINEPERLPSQGDEGPPSQRRRSQRRR